MDDTERVQLANTKEFLLLEKDSRGRNRGPNQYLLDQLDPMGQHLVAFKFVHNDVEWRCCWLVKLKNVDTPVELFMDNGFDPLDKHTQTVTVPLSYSPSDGAWQRAKGDTQ